MEVIIIGLYGPMGSGKTSVAAELVRQHEKTAVQVRFADPLYRFASLCAKWRFADSDRAAFDVFDLSTELLGGRAAASFVDVSTAVYQELPALADEHLSEFSRTGVKPRRFLQLTGDLFRGLETDCFATFLAHSIMKDTQRRYEAWQFDRDLKEKKLGATFELVDRDTIPDSLRVPPFQRIFVVDDLRFPNEYAELARLSGKLKTFLGDDFNVITRLVKLDMEPQAAAQRCAIRDERPIAEVLDTLGHCSEGGLNDYEFDSVVDASQKFEDVVADVWGAVTGKTRTIKGSNVVDLSALRKK